MIFFSFFPKHTHFIPWRMVSWCLENLPLNSFSQRTSQAPGEHKRLKTGVLHVLHTSHRAATRAKFSLTQVDSIYPFEYMVAVQGCNRFSHPRLPNIKSMSFAYIWILTANLLNVLLLVSYFSTAFKVFPKDGSAQAATLRQKFQIKLAN